MKRNVLAKNQVFFSWMGALTRVRAMKTIFFVLVMVVTMAGVNAQPPSHDPSTMIRNTDGRYWIFTTGGGIWCMSSSNNDFTDWRAEKTPYTATSYPAWIKTYAPNFKGEFWAPEVVNVNGQFRLYYSCTSDFGSKNSCIGLATASNLSGPWTDQGMVVYSNSGTSENAIDPAIYANSWMVYGSFFGGIKLTALSSNGKATGTRYTLANGDTEAPYIIKNGNYYYLFINKGSCCRKEVYATYNIQVGRSTSITGPYLDKTGKNLTAGGGTQVAKTSGRYIGPGHFGYGNGKVTYHFYDGNDNGNAKLRITTLSWSSDGWPIISGGGARLGEESEEAEQIMSMYPNPAPAGKFKLRLDPRDDEATVTVVNMQGQVVFTQAYKGMQEVDIDSQLKAGTYVVKIQQKSVVETKTILVD